MKIRIIITLSLLLSTNALMAQDKYQDGLSAFDSKKYKTAIKLLRPYADSGKCVAQFVVGFCYSQKDKKFTNDSLASVYLLKASEQKHGRAMGLYATFLFGKSYGNESNKINGLVWAELAAKYDPIQKGTTTRHLFRSYMTPEEIEKAEQIIKEKQAVLDKIDNCA